MMISKICNKRIYIFWFVHFTGTEGVATDYTVKQLNQQIERLKEALVK